MADHGSGEGSEGIVGGKGDGSSSSNSVTGINEHIHPPQIPPPPPTHQPPMQQFYQGMTASANPYAAYYQQMYGMNAGAITHPYHAWYQTATNTNLNLNTNANINVNPNNANPNTNANANMNYPKFGPAAQAYPFVPMMTAAPPSSLPPGQPLPPWHVSKRPPPSSSSAAASHTNFNANRPPPSHTNFNANTVPFATSANAVPVYTAPNVVVPPTKIIPPIKVEVVHGRPVEIKKIDSPPKEAPKRVQPSNTPSSSSTDQWPPSLKEYVGRCFAGCSSESERDRMETHLRKRIQRAIEKDRLYTIDWSKEPIVRLSPNAGKSEPNFTAPEKQSATATKSHFKVQTKRDQRAQRFLSQETLNISATPLSASASLLQQPSADVIDWDQYTIVGTCQTLEKPYLRLTSAPDPRTVRPLPVLRDALEMVRERWRGASKTGSNAEYGYCCDQLKSIRQDLTVQRIKNDFTVKVYEVHARLALEHGDLGEYNQCQGQLRQLYRLLRNSSSTSSADRCCANEAEFAAYRLLYLLLHTRNQVEVSAFLDELASREHDALAHSAPVIHALRVRAALAVSNYHQFFRLYRTAPNMGGYLMDAFVPRQRLTALTVLCRAFRPSISLAYLEGLLAFPDGHSCRTFLTDTVQACWWPEGADGATAEAIDAKSTLAVLLMSK